MKFEITNRLTGETLYTCELPPEIADKPYSMQLGYAIHSAVSDGISLREADLRRADLLGAGFSESPIKINNIHQAIYRSASQPDALDMSDWHTRCGTAHCRAGWVIALAGDAGKELESRVGTSVAAALIYMSNDPELERIPNFYCDAETALADMKRLSELEAARPGAVAYDPVRLLNCSNT